MDKGKIMNQLQQKMSEHYCEIEVLEHLGCLALKVGNEIIAYFRDWDADCYYMECGPDLTEWALSNSILLEFYKEGRKLLEKPIEKYAVKKYAVKVLKDDIATLDSRYLSVNYQRNLVAFSDEYEIEGWHTLFTKSEIEELKKRNDIAIDWNKAEIEEMNNYGRED